MITALLHPMGAVSAVEPAAGYDTGAFITGFLDGYDTMDALASLAFGIVVINVIRGLGVEEPHAIARSTVSAGVFSCAMMALIYLAVAVVGAQSRGLFDTCANGGEVLTLVADHYFGTAGALILAVTVTFACLKTAVGLVTSCAETFCALFPRALSYRKWAVLFSVVSLLIANLGLTAITAYSVPVLMLLYPLAITLILLGLFGERFGHSRYVYGCVTGFTLCAAVFDLLRALPQAAIDALHVQPLLDAAAKVLPLFSHGLGWVLPALLGLIVGLCVMRAKEGAKRS